MPGQAASLVGAVEPHQTYEVRDKIAQFRTVKTQVQENQPLRVIAQHLHLHHEETTTTQNPQAGDNQKICYFIRHGEGTHNVAQRNWRSDPKWDGSSEPYTLHTDAHGKYLDAELNDTGIAQARALQERASTLSPQLLVVSPLRRATRTGLVAFEEQISNGLNVVALELLHETAGRHTCDRRLSRTALQETFPQVNYSEIDSEEDPLWGDGMTRESNLSIATRASQFTEWLASRPEQRIAVATHSGFLCALFTSVLQYASSQEQEHVPSPWFGTGEMRAMRLTFAAKC